MAQGSASGGVGGGARNLGAPPIEVEGKDQRKNDKKKDKTTKESSNGDKGSCNENAPSHANTETIPGAVGNAIVARANRSLSDAATLAFMRTATAAPATTIHVASRAYATSRPYPEAHYHTRSASAAAFSSSAPATVTTTRAAPLFGDTSTIYVVPSTPSPLPCGLPAMHNEATAPAALSSTLPSSDDNDLRNPFGDHAATNNAASSPFVASTSFAIAAHVDEDTVNDDSLNSDETVVPIAQMGLSIFAAPGTPGSAVDPPHASTESFVADARAAAAFGSRDSSEDPFITPGRHRPLANPVSSAASSSNTSAAFGSHAASETLPTLRHPNQAHTVQRGRRRLGDLMTGRESTVSPGDAGRDQSRGTMATITTVTSNFGGGSSRPTTITTAPTTTSASLASIINASLNSPGRGRSDSVRGVKDGKVGCVEVKKKKGLSGFVRAVSGVFGRKDKDASGEGRRKSSGLGLLGARKKLHADASIELRPFLNDSVLAHGGGSLGLPSSGLGSRYRSGRGAPSGPGYQVQRETGFGHGQSVANSTAPGPAFVGAAVGSGMGTPGGGAAGGRSPNINKPLPPNPPKDDGNGDEDEAESKGKGKAHEDKEGKGKGR